MNRNRYTLSISTVFNQPPTYENAVPNALLSPVVIKKYDDTPTPYHSTNTSNPRTNQPGKLSPEDRRMETSRTHHLIGTVIFFAIVWLQVRTVTFLGKTDIPEPYLTIGYLWLYPLLFANAFQALGLIIGWKPTRVDSKHDDVRMVKGAAVLSSSATRGRAEELLAVRHDDIAASKRFPTRIDTAGSSKTKLTQFGDLMLYSFGLLARLLVGLVTIITTVPIIIDVSDNHVNADTRWWVLRISVVMLSAVAANATFGLFFYACGRDRGEYGVEKASPSIVASSMSPSADLGPEKSTQRTIIDTHKYTIMLVIFVNCLLVGNGLHIAVWRMMILESPGSRTGTIILAIVWLLLVLLRMFAYIGAVVVIFILWDEITSEEIKEDVGLKRASEKMDCWSKRVSEERACKENKKEEAVCFQAPNIAEDSWVNVQKPQGEVTKGKYCGKCMPVYVLANCDGCGELLYRKEG